MQATDFATSIRQAHKALWIHKVCSCIESGSMCSAESVLGRLHGLIHIGLHSHTQKKVNARNSLIQLMNPFAIAGAETNGAEPGNAVDISMRAKLKRLEMHGGQWAADSTASLHDIADSLKPFHGAGNGLTPSGDDFICGIVLAMHRSGLQTEASTLTLLLLDDAQKSTHELSCFQLRRAGEGFTSEPLICALEVLTGKTVPQETEYQLLSNKISDYGASSGWDCLAGVFFYFRHSGLHP